MSIPLLRAICRWADGHCPVRVLFGSPQHFELVREEGLDLVPLYYRPKYQGLQGLMRLCANLRGKVDLVIGVPQVPARRLVILKIALGASYSAGEAFPLYRPLLSFSAGKSWTKSILKTQEEIAKCLMVDMPLGLPSITLTESELEWSKVVLVRSGISQARPIIGVHCSASKPSNKWPPEYFGQVLLALKEKFPELAIVSFGMNNERQDSDTVRQAVGAARWLDGVGRWTIRESLAVLRQCDLLMSGDTGIMHMAAAVGTKTLSIFGPTAPSRLAPTYNGGVSVGPEVPCHPCYRDKYRQCTCIQLVSPAHVAKVAMQLLVSIPSRGTLLGR